MRRLRNITVIQLIVVSSFPFLSACGLIFGGAQKIDQKNSDYQIYRLDKDSNWLKIKTGESSKIETEALSASEQEPELSDYAYENKLTKVIISLNSVCRPQKNFTLQALSNNLIMGLPNPKQLEQKYTIVDGADALQTTVETQPENQDPVKIQTVVTKKSSCTFDFMYIAKPQYYETHLADFEKFIKGFHIE